MAAKAAVDKLVVELIRRHLATEIVGRHLYLFDGIPSTNAALRDLALSGAEEGTVVLAEGQSEGRGRLGAAWFSPPGLNLYVSVLFRPAIALSAVPVFSFIASLALTDAVWAAGLPAAIKWPNDVLVEGRKVAGCLVDVAAAGAHADHVILGVGVNLNVATGDLQATLGQAGKAAGSMSELAGHPVDRNVFTAAFLNLLEKWLGVYRVDGRHAILAAWRSRDALSGREVEVRGEGAPYRGRAAGVEADGPLVVVEASGVRHRVLTGEVRLAGDADSA